MNGKTMGLNPQKERFGQLHRAWQCIGSQPWLCLAFTCYWIWVNMVYQTPVSFPNAEILPGYSIPTRLLPVAVSILTYLALSIWFKRSTGVVRQSWYPILLVVIMSAGSFLAVLWASSEAQLIAASTLTETNLATFNLATGNAALRMPLLASLFIAAVLVGVSSACLCIEMQRVFGHLGSQYVLFVGCFAMLVSSLIIFALSFGPELLQQAALILSPLPIALGVRKTVRRINAKGFYTHGLTAQLFIPYRFLFTALLHGLSIGVTIGFLPLFDKSYGAVHLIVLSYALAAVLLFTITVLFRSDYNHLIYQIGFPLVALGALFVLFLSGLSEIGFYVQLFGFCFLHLVMWGVCTYFIKNLNLPATWVIATSTCAFMCGQFLGGTVSTWVAALPEVEQNMRIVAALVIFVVLFGSLLLISNRNLKTGWGLARFGSNELSDATSELAIRALIVEYALTKREADTLRLLVRGKSRKAISDELFVSEETIKYHAHSIYGKLTVHSRQELITIFDERRLQAQLEEPASQFE